MNAKSKWFIGQRLIHVSSGNKSIVIQLYNSGVLLKQCYLYNYQLNFDYEESLEELRMYYIEYAPPIDIEYNEI